LLFGGQRVQGGLQVGQVSRPAPAATRALRILDFLAAHPTESFTLSEMAKHLELSLGSAHAVLNAMTDAGYLVRHPSHKTYRLGPSAIAVGHAALESHPIIDIARDEMRRVAQDLDLECLASVPLGEELVVVARAGRPRPGGPLVLVGARLPLVPPLGTMYMAWSEPEEIQSWLDRANPSEPPARVARYRDVLVSARVLGYSVGVIVDGVAEAVAPVEGDPARLDLDPGEAYSVSYIAATTFDEGGRVALVINLDGFRAPLAPDAITDVAAELTDAAAAITHGAHGRLPPGLRAGG
jgi:DNA-binding IclR family transcriptional regulator